MKTKLQILSVALLGIILTSCSSSMNMSKSSGNSSDDIYYSPIKSQVANYSENNLDIKKVENTNQKQNDFAQLEDKYKKILASDSTNIDTVIYKAEQNKTYNGIFSNSYQESLERRQSSIYDTQNRMADYSTYSDYFFYASTYNPAYYNVVVMGNKVWVEPWYISRMFPNYWSSTYFGYGYWGYGLGLNWLWGPRYTNFYSEPGYFYHNWDSWSPYHPYGYNYSNFNYYFNDYYYGPRYGNTTTSISNQLRGDNSYEDQIVSSRRRDGLNTSARGNNLDTRTRNVNQTDLTRSGDRNSNQEITRRGNRSDNLSTTRLREGSGSTQNTSLTEPTRRNNNNNYQRSRTTNNDRYIRTGTRNQNTDATNINNNTSRDNSNVREGRNTTPTYNRPNRVDTSTERTRNSNAGSSNRETNYRSSGGRSSSGNTATRTSSSSGSGSSSGSNQSNSSGGSDSRRR